MRKYYVVSKIQGIQIHTKKPKKNGLSYVVFTAKTAAKNFVRKIEKESNNV